MAAEDSFSFDAAFRALTGNDPFPWQRQLYDEWMLQGKVPFSCDIPTGLGKTAVVAVWLIALAHRPDGLPRRLVYVVNRRTVVDQTTNEVMKLRDNAAKIGIEDLAISTLRGQFADNREWSADPARPAVIVGTVDMIGSRLLFSGYGVGFKAKPLHAGFLGQDVLLVHDEAHLEPAFQRLLIEIQREQERCKEFRPFRVMALTATSREAKTTSQGGNFTLTEEEKSPPAAIPDPPTEPIHWLWRRVKAHKAVHLVSVENERKQLADMLAELALKFNASRRPILVFARTVENVEKVASRLHKERQQVRRLTGTMRGRERDRLVDDPVFRRFLPKADPGDETVYLVCTSAGEVGVNITGDHLVCDLTTFESMAQRFGRVNRFGDRTDTVIHVVYPEEFGEEEPYEEARRKTLELLQRLNGDGSPATLGELDPAARAAAFAPEPTILPATDILFDAWALTTIRGRLPGRPPVAPYLHGVAEWEPPETHVAWRDEVSIVKGGLLEQHPPKDLLEDYPLKPHELLRDRSDRVFDAMQTLARRHPGAPVWLVDDQGTVEPLSLTDLADPTATKAPARRQLIARIQDCTILLPPAVGGLSGGMLDGGSGNADDVSDVKAPDTERRFRVWSDDPDYDARTKDMRLVRSIEMNREDDTEERPTWDWYECKPLADTRTAQRPVPWESHVVDAVTRIDRILAKLSIPPEIAQAIRVAVQLHDAGKRRAQFQCLLGNREYPKVVWAKSGRNGAKLPDTYRHEFGSLADALEDPDFQRLSAEMQDLVLHLIAAHHGRARPHIPAAEAFDPQRPQSEADARAAEVPRRFARLQRKYGRWGLAYLESLLRAADWAASAEPSEFVTETREVTR